MVLSYVSFDAMILEVEVDIMLLSSLICSDCFGVSTCVVRFEADRRLLGLKLVLIHALDIVDNDLVGVLGFELFFL